MRFAMQLVCSILCDISQGTVIRFAYRFTKVHDNTIMVRRGTGNYYSITTVLSPV